MRKLYKFFIPLIIFSVILSISIPASIQFNQSNFTRVWRYNSENYIEEIDVSNDFKYLIAGTYDNLYVFDLISGNLLWNKSGENIHVKSVSISSNGDFFAAGLCTHSNGYIYYFESRNSTPLWEYRSLELEPIVSISSDGENFVAIYNSYTIIFFDSSNSLPLWNATTENQSQIKSLFISSDGNYVIKGDLAGNAYFLNNTDIPSKRSLWNFTTGNEVNAVAISSGNAYIAVGSNDNTVFVLDKYNSTSKRPLWNYTTQGDIKTVDFTHNEKYLVVASSDDKIYVFDTSNSRLKWTYLSSAEILSVALSHDSNYATVGDIEGNIYLLEIESGKLISNFNVRGESYSLKISSEGNYISCANHYTDLSVSEYRLYLFDRSDPSYGKDVSYFNSLLLQNIVIYGLPTTAIFLSSAFLIQFILRKLVLRKERIEKERIFKKLDEKFDDWADEDKTKKN